jgi:hypothetical protein
MGNTNSYSGPPPPPPPPPLPPPPPPPYICPPDWLQTPDSIDPVRKGTCSGYCSGNNNVSFNYDNRDPNTYSKYTSLATYCSSIGKSGNSGGMIYTQGPSTATQPVTTIQPVTPTSQEYTCPPGWIQDSTDSKNGNCGVVCPLLPNGLIPIASFPYGPNHPKFPGYPIDRKSSSDICNDIINGVDYSQYFNNRINTWPPNPTTNTTNTTGNTFSFYNPRPEGSITVAPRPEGSITVAPRPEGSITVAPRPEGLTDPEGSRIVAPRPKPVTPPQVSSLDKTIIPRVNDIYVYGFSIIIIILILIILIIKL